ncbi:MAG TPA: maleylpyruvate isomerase N-terminal domain-containing protein [Pseudonocardia sp.]|nr:maleylpyruvate isomerase N-terminal domain-containing protein [Pseudonocardia sp.]
MSPATLVDAIPPLDHDEAMTLAEAEISRLLALVDDLDTDEWPRPTDCTGWTVRDMLGHLLAAPRGHLPLPLRDDGGGPVRVDVTVSSYVFCGATAGGRWCSGCPEHRRPSTSRPTPTESSSRR